MGKIGGECMKSPRPYRDVADLSAMRSLLVAGRMADNGSYYIHTGDLSYWLYYPPLEGDCWKDIYLWDDPEHPGRILGWALLSPNWVGFDVYVQPELRGSALAAEMYLWAEQRTIEIARSIGKKTISALWIRRDDQVLDGHFKQQGYRLTRCMVHMSCHLDGEISSSMLAEGFKVRSCKGLKEVSARAKTQYRTFASKAPFEQYLERFRNFMRSPVYERSQDIVAVHEDGLIGAFCIVWIDPLSRVGLFEPVGTHPDFLRKGLGRAVMLEGLRRLQQSGMRQAIVSTYEDNQAAIKLYESTGFQVVTQLGTYEKEI
jgi:mycothiol synthase